MAAARVCALLLVSVLSSCMVRAQTESPGPLPRTMELQIEVEAGKAQPVPGLTQSAFTLLDNGVPQAITSFRAVHAGQQPVHVTLLLDAVNTAYNNVAYERNEVVKYFGSVPEPLTDPVQIAILTDKGVQIAEPYTTDRAVLLKAVNSSSIPLREITRSAGFWGATERVQDSLKGLQQLVAGSAVLPGRKLLIWISPGWPLLTGPQINLNSKEQDRIFRDAVFYSTQLLLAHITLYNINPLGINEPLLRRTYYQSYLKAARNPSEVQIANLGLQVLSVQSGGLALEASSDIAGAIRRCLQDAQDWYELSFEMLRADRPDEYHHLEIRLADPALQARTRDGYYAQR